MPYLTVLGTGAWGNRARRYQPGVHEISEEVADEVRASGIERLLITDVKPEIVTGDIHRPDEVGLRAEDVRVGVSEGVRLAGVEEHGAEIETDPVPAEVEMNYACLDCPAKRVTVAALQRHHEMAHSIKPSG